MSGSSRTPDLSSRPAMPVPTSPPSTWPNNGSVWPMPNAWPSSGQPPRSPNKPSAPCPGDHDRQESGFRGAQDRRNRRGFAIEQCHGSPRSSFFPRMVAQVPGGEATLTEPGDWEVIQALYAAGVGLDDRARRDLLAERCPDRRRTRPGDRKDVDHLVEGKPRYLGKAGRI